MASKHPKPRQSRRGVGRAHLFFGLFIIGALAAGTFGVGAVVHWQSVPVAESGSTRGVAGKVALPAGQARRADDTQSAWAAKATDQQPSKPIQLASVKMSVEQWQSLDGIFVRQIKRCWTAPPARGPSPYVPKIKVEFAPNGALLGKPIVMNPAKDAVGKAQAANAIKAVASCKQLHIPSTFAAFYDEWRTRVINFDPTIADTDNASR